MTRKKKKEKGKLGKYNNNIMHHRGAKRKAACEDEQQLSWEKFNGMLS